MLNLGSFLCKYACYSMITVTREKWENKFLTMFLIKFALLLILFQCKCSGGWIHSFSPLSPSMRGTPTRYVIKSPMPFWMRALSKTPKAKLHVRPAPKPTRSWSSARSQPRPMWTMRRLWEVLVEELGLCQPRSALMQIKCKVLVNIEQQRPDIRVHTAWWECHKWADYQGIERACD